MTTLWFFTYLLFWCLIFAILEAQIEGPNGWATALPTARYHWDPVEKILTYRGFAQTNWITMCPDPFWHKLIIKYILHLLDGKDWTYYHRVVDIIQIFIAHILVYHCYHSEVWLILELRVLAAVLLIWSLEDTLWFYVNPEASKSEHHPSWVMLGKYRLMATGMFKICVVGLILFPITLYMAEIGYKLWAFFV
jgi:hypothetical protein